MIHWLLLGIGYCLYWYYRRLYHNSREPPILPGSYPIIGYNHRLLTTKSSDLWEVAQIIADEADQVGGTSLFRIGVWPVYVITDSKISAMVLNNCLEKDDIYTFFHPWMGTTGLFSGPVSIWRPLRKIMLPAFNQSLVYEFTEVINNDTKRLVQDLSCHSGKDPFDISHYLGAQTLRNFCFNFMGYNLEDEVLTKEYLEAVEDYLQIFVDRLVNPFLHSKLIFKLIQGKRSDKVVAVLHKLMYKIVENRRKQRKENSSNNNVNDNPSKKEISGKHKIAIDILMDLVDGGKMPETQMEDEINSYLFGAHDTSATSMVFLLVLLGSFPEIQEKVYQEIMTEIGYNDLKKEDFSKLTYIEACIKEAIRLYPITALIPRYIHEDQKFDSFTLAAGSRCLVVAYKFHRNSSWGPDAQEFVPERWLDPARLPESPTAFMGFSWGKRNCMGQKYAMMVMKIQIVHLIRNYRIAADYTKMALKLTPLLKAASGHQISIERRN